MLFGFYKELVIINSTHNLTKRVFNPTPGDLAYSYIIGIKYFPIIKGFL